MRRVLKKYHEEAAFKELWRTAETAEGTYVIIWDKTPGNQWTFPQVPVKDHLTPLHWAICAARWAHEYGREFDVWVIDLAPTAHEILAICKAFKLLNLKNIPWLHIVPGGEATQAFDKLKDPNYQLSKVDDISSKMLLEIVRTGMVSQSDRGGRHALANVLTPLLLMSDYLPEDVLAIGLRKLMSALGYDSALIEPVECDTKVLEDIAFDAILIDDMAMQGWDKWLRGEIKRSTKRDVNVTPWIDSKTIIKQMKLYEFPTGANVEKYVQGPNRIVFLDIRLFGRDKQSDEDAFNQEIKEIFETIPQNSRPWREVRRRPGRISKEEKLMQDRLSVARLLAQADPLLPVILFSSSTDSNVLKELSVYGNIINVFSKPALFGASAESSMTYARLRLREALEAAEKLLRVRDKCRKIIQSARPVAGTTLASQQKVHVELYLDESGPKNPPDSIDRVGGVLAIYVDENAVGAADSFDDCAVENELRYFQNSFDLHPRSKTVLSKYKPGDTGKAQLRTALQAFNGEPGHARRIQLGAVLVKLPNSIRPARVGLSDTYFWKLLKCVVETFLTESLSEIASYLQVRTVTYSIYCGTRSVHADVWGDVHAKHGFYFNKSNRLLRTFDEHDLYWIIEGLERQVGPQYKCERAIGVRLPYDKNKQGALSLPEMVRHNGLVWRLDRKEDKGAFVARIGHKKHLLPGAFPCDCRYDYRALHYVADQWLRTPDVFDGIISTSVPGSFKETWNPAQPRPSAEAAHHLNRDDLARAIWKVPIPAHRDEAGAMVCRRIKEAMGKKLDGKAILAIRDLFSIEP